MALTATLKTPIAAVADQHTDHAQVAFWPFVQSFATLALIGAVIYLFRLEESIGLVKLMPLILLGFGLHAWLPLRWRLPFHFLLTSAGMLFLLGTWDGSILIFLGLMLFAIVQLPLSVPIRIALLLGATAGLALVRINLIPLAGVGVILPILGAMFMFRSMLYLYEMQFERESAGFWKKINYFFLLPNLIFLIFPVVDYNTFVRNHYSKPAFETYQRGLYMMANGLFHLFLYRLIYYYLLPAPTDVDSLYTLMQFMVASYALIVRLAGIFHFSVGVICLFGFYLPPSFNLYFLANSFSDIWRRINIYWRDFVTKVFYFPIYFRIKKYGTTAGMVIAILLVFAINWFLHGFQWFWIRGSFPLTPQDISFWAIFGVAVAANTYLQTKQRPVIPAYGKFSSGYALRNSFQIVGMFTFMTILWSYWTCNTIAEWLVMVSVIKEAPLAQFLVIIGIGIGLAALVYLGHYLVYLYQKQGDEGISWERVGMPVFNLGLIGMMLFGLPFIHEPLAEKMQADLSPVLEQKLNTYDRELRYRGYYETLLTGTNMTNMLGDAEQKRPDEWRQFSNTGAGIPRGDIMLKELKPNYEVPFKGALFTSNSLGLRDREYMAEKPANTFRIALLGGSIEMGVGVETMETYENLVEDRLNELQILGEDVRIEILNFGISGNHMFQNIKMYEEKAVVFAPDAVIYTAHPNESHRILHSIHKAWASGKDMVYPMLLDFMHEHNFSRVTTFAEYMKVAGPREAEIVQAGYKLLYELIVDNGQLPIWTFIPALDDNEGPTEAEDLKQLLSAIGYFPLIINNAFEGYKKEDLMIAEFDAHPNKKGHELLAEEMLRQILANQPLLDAWRQRMATSDADVQ
jgi:D-alanyl-lipoteichoic acid acyltransferase DltB (MBOAT superfamily)